jgi:hypothetical protein
MPYNTPTLARFGLAGIQKQTAEGTLADGSSVTWLPLSAAPGLALRVNSQLIDQADRHGHDWLEFSAGQWYEGPLQFHLYPGMVSNLLDWVQTRGADYGTPWLTVWIIDQNGSLVRSSKDVKVATLDVELMLERPLSATLNLVGKSDNVVAGPSAPAASALTNIQPFIFKDGSFQFYAVGYYGGSQGTQQGYTVKDARLHWDNHLQPPAQGMRWTGSYNPYTLYNEGQPSFGGSTSRDFINTDFYNAWRAAHEIGGAGTQNWYDMTYDGSFLFSLQRGALSIHWKVDRVRWTVDDTGMLGSRRGTQTERLDWIALAHADDATIVPCLMY